MNAIRSAIGDALDHPFAEEAFDLVDQIEEAVSDLDFDGDPDHHETAAEIADSILSGYSTREVANLWAILQADEEGADLYGSATRTGERVSLDLFVVVERAVHAALEAAAALPHRSGWMPGQES